MAPTGCRALPARVNEDLTRRETERGNVIMTLELQAHELWLVPLVPALYFMLWVLWHWWKEGRPTNRLDSFTPRGARPASNVFQGWRN